MESQSQKPGTGGAGRKRLIKCSFSPRGKRSTLASPNTARIQAIEKENVLNVLAQQPTTQKGNEGGKNLFDLWRSPKIKRDLKSNGIGSSPLSRKGSKNVIGDEAEMQVVDIEDFGGIGSSFFSESDLLDDIDLTDIFTKEELKSEQDLKKPSSGFLRLVIDNVERCSSRNNEQNQLQQPQNILKCHFENDKSIAINVILRGLWIHCDYQPGVIISVPSNNNDFQLRDILIDGETTNFLAYDPDTLITVTAVADAVSCLRKATLSMQMQAAPVDNPPTINLVSGSISHDAFEQGIQDPTRLNDMTDLIMTAVKGHLGTVYACQRSEEDVRTMVVDILRTFPTWCQKVLRDKPIHEVTVVDELRSSLSEKSKQVCIPSVHSLEESIVSRELGLKGKIDSIVAMRFSIKEGESLEEYLVPLELKTGKSTTSTAHRAQTLIYTVLLSHQYSIKVPYGLLFYVASNTLLRLTPRNDELQALMMARNRLASANRLAWMRLPRPIDNTHSCRQCGQLANCAVMGRIMKEEFINNEAITAKFHHLSGSADDSFYRKWDTLLRLEEGEAMKGKKEARVNFLKRSLLLQSCVKSDGNGFAVGRFQAIFSIPSDEGMVELNGGDPVVIFNEADITTEVAIGFVKSITRDSLSISCDRDLSTNVSNTFAISRDELMTGWTLCRSNLVRLYSASQVSLYELIAQQRTPKFLSSQSFDVRLLEGDQREAVIHCLKAQDYSLILGMPGTGKTTTLVGLIQCLVEGGKKVLVSSYTHSAVDNLLAKVMQTGISVLRLGTSDRIDSRLTNRVIDDATHFPSIAAIHQAISTTQVYGVTCLGVNNPILTRLHFDYCIVDEAAQISMPAVLGPLMLADKFILVGDHYQLPPLVRSKEANNMGLATSLFQVLAERHPLSVATLSHQYRMCEDIQAIANAIVYNGKLICANDKVRNASLDISVKVDGWLSIVHDPKNKVIFIDTDPIDGGAYETEVGSSFLNVKEAKLIQMIVNSFLQVGILPEQLAIIAAFKPQVREITNLIDNIEVSTVDRFQGRDRDCVIFSFVRSNLDQNIGSLLRDWHRLNVAFTRAKRKLIIVGSWSTVMMHPEMTSLRELLLARKWVYKLPNGTLFNIEYSIAALNHEYFSS